LGQNKKTGKSRVWVLVLAIIIIAIATANNYIFFRIKRRANVQEAPENGLDGTAGVLRGGGAAGGGLWTRKGGDPASQNFAEIAETGKGALTAHAAAAENRQQAPALPLPNHKPQNLVHLLQS
jgi:hypothetical protein